MVRWGLYEEMATRGDAAFHFTRAARLETGSGESEAGVSPP